MNNQDQREKDKDNLHDESNEKDYEEEEEQEEVDGLIASAPGKPKVSGEVDCDPSCLDDDDDDF